MSARQLLIREHEKLKDELFLELAQIKEQLQFELKKRERIEK